MGTPLAELDRAQLRAIAASDRPLIPHECAERARLAAALIEPGRLDRTGPGEAVLLWRDVPHCTRRYTTPPMPTQPATGLTANLRHPGRAPDHIVSLTARDRPRLERRTRYRRYGREPIIRTAVSAASELAFMPGEDGVGGSIANVSVSSLSSRGPMQPIGERRVYRTCSDAPPARPRFPRVESSAPPAPASAAATRRATRAAT